MPQRISAPVLRALRIWLLLLSGVGTIAPRCSAQASQAPPPDQRPAAWSWVWAPDGAKPPETLFFRQTFTLAHAPASARLFITADDAFTAYLNQRRAATGSDWTTVGEFDAARYLHEGDNLLAVEARNTGGAGGLLYKLVVRYRGGRSLVMFSGTQVKVNRRAPPVWSTLPYDDSKWPHAVVEAPANGGVWGQLHSAPAPDATRIVPIWDIRAGGDPAADPYTRIRHPGDRMLMSVSAYSPSDMQILASEGFTLFQTDSDHLSTEQTGPKSWDFTSATAARDEVKRLGLDWCYSPHYAFPPPWYRKSVAFTRLSCLEHKLPVQAFSPWDPTWPYFIKDGYEELGKTFGSPDRTRETVDADSQAPARLNALYVGIMGDYGEAGYMTGARVSVPGQREDWLRRFGNLHDHIGWWCDDPLARADFRSAMLKQYGGLDALNAAWKRAFKKPEDIVYPDGPRPEAPREWLDFTAWYDGGVAHAIDLNLGAARSEFPGTLRILPAGLVDEDPRGGNDNSLIPKIAASYGADVRSTHGAFKPFAENAATMLGRLASASRFYGAPFWTEPPGDVTPDQEVQRIFESVSEGSKGYFDWARNAVAARDVFYRYSKFLRVGQPIVDVAVFYPAVAQRLKPEQGYAPLFAQACAYLRDVANFDVVDDRMVDDGCLARYRILVLVQSTMADQVTLDRIKQWVADGGTLLAYDFGKIVNLDGDTSWFKEMLGYVQQLSPARVAERYEGTVPQQYRIPVADPAAAPYLAGDWYEPEAANAAVGRWTGAAASVRAPVLPDQQYLLVIRAQVPEAAVKLKRTVTVNGTAVGDLEAPGDVTYRFLVSADTLSGAELCTIGFQCETFQPSVLIAGSRDGRRVGALIESVQLVAQDAKEDDDAPPPTGTLQRDIDWRSLKSEWAQRYGKGLTIYFPATQRLGKWYIELVRQAVYHLSAIDPGRRDALPIDNQMDGVYATLFADRVLYYNPKDTPVTKTVSIPPETFAAWKDEVVTPADTNWRVTIEPHSIAAVYFKPPPQEVLLECERFGSLGGMHTASYADCSPGEGVTCVRMLAGSTISTAARIEVPARYSIYTRCVRSGRPVAVHVYVDGRHVSDVNARAGATVLAGTVALSRGLHVVALRTPAAVRADFVILSGEPTIAGYNFALKSTPVQ